MSNQLNTRIPINGDEKEFITSYWTERAVDFMKLRQEELHSPKYALWKDEISKHLPKENKTLKILDIGCGAGFFSILLAHLGHDLTGIDLTPKMISESKALAQLENCKAHFLIMDAENLSFQDNTFDMIISRNVTWNLPHPHRAYEEWLRVLKPGGILLNYDAEHARNHHAYTYTTHSAHENISPTLMDKCHSIYHMLEISGFNRPEWDRNIVEQLPITTCTIDKTVGDRIYKDEDQFYITAPMFCIKIIK